jgi:hypothetical protein
MKLPLVSIIIPVYNGSKYLKEAIDSAIGQTYKNIEIVVVNDGSNDNGKTEAVAKSYGNKIRYFSKQNGGVSSALNYAIKMSKGDYISWVSHDDLIYPNKIEAQIDYLKNNDLLNKDVIIYSDHSMINKNGELIEICQKQFDEFGEKSEYALLHGKINGITLLIPKKAYDDCGLFNETLVAVQDYEMWERMFKKYKVIHLPLVLSASRYHSKQVTNVSPKVKSEGNPFWIKLMEDITDKRKIELDGSLYNFYSNMSSFLKNTPYNEAKDYCDNKCNEIFKIFKDNKITDKVTVIAFTENKSINKQTYKNIDIITVDKNDDWVLEVKKSIKSTYITFANKEEIFSKNKIEKQLEFMKLNDAKVSIINNSNYSSLNRIVTGNFSLSSIMITKDLFEELDDKNIIKSILEITKKNYLFEIKDKLIEHEIYSDETDIKKYCMYKELLQYCSNDNHYKKNDNLLSTIAEEYHKYANKIGRVDIYNNPVVETSWGHVKKSIIMDGFFKTIIKIIKKILRRK